MMVRGRCYTYVGALLIFVYIFFSMITVSETTCFDCFFGFQYLCNNNTVICVAKNILCVEYCLYVLKTCTYI